MSSDSIPLFLFGNGLSMALSPEFSLKKITQTFINSLEGNEKDFLEQLCGGADKINFDDFEENFSKLEDAYNSLLRYNGFLKSNVGTNFLNHFNLPNPDLDKHEEIIKSIYHKYIFQILGIIRNKVTKQGIQDKLPSFTAFLRVMLSNIKGYVFTLNYDLLAEAIMLEEIGTKNITDFCSKTGFFKGTEIFKYDFDPAMNEDKFGTGFMNDVVELHHLHGSLSLFYDHSRNKAIKFCNEDIFTNDIYNSIFEYRWPLCPAIITGGGKSLKMNEYPFEFYFRRFKELTTYGKFNKLFIVGYSFRDEHVNDLIKRWIKTVEDYASGLLIVDFRSTPNEMILFKKQVKKCLHLQKPIPDKCFEFGGANAIHDILGTITKIED